MLILAAVMAVGGLVVPASAEQVTVTGRISDSCSRMPGEFTVPSGTTASGFRLDGLSAGRTCGTNQPINERGFSILDRNFNPAYRYTGDASLASLTLQPGRYYLSVDGGVGATVTVTFEVK